jgi:hypothetical protein
MGLHKEPWGTPKANETGREKEQFYTDTLCDQSDMTETTEEQSQR